MKRALYLGLSLTLITVGFLALSTKVDRALADAPTLHVNYVSSNESKPGTGWSDNTVANAGNFVDYYIEISNSNFASTADSLKVSVQLPESAGGTNTSTASITTTSCSGGSCSPTDTTTVALISSTSALVYQAGTTKVTADLNQDGTKEYNGTVWADGIVGSGITLGNFKGGATAIQVYFRAHASAGVSPNLTANVLGANLSVPGSTFTETTPANVGQTVKIYLGLHNTAVPSEAKNVRIKATIPDTFANSSVITLSISADNAASVSDTTTFTFPSSLKLVYTAGSVRLTWDPNGDGVKDYNESPIGNGDDIVGGSGLLLPSSLFGCNQYILQLTFLGSIVASSTPTPTPTPTATPTPTPTATPTPTVTVAPAAGCTLSIDKKVRLGDGREVDSVDAGTHVYQSGETLTYRLFITNTSVLSVPNVTVQDFLAPYMTFVSGDLAYDPGANRLDSNQGTFAGAESRTLSYIAKVKDSVPAGNTNQENTVRVFKSGEQCSANTSTIVIGKPGAILASATTQLPVTGATEPKILLGTGLSLLGYLLRDVRKSGKGKFRV